MEKRYLTKSLFQLAMECLEKLYYINMIHGQLTADEAEIENRAELCAFIYGEKDEKVVDPYELLPKLFDDEADADYDTSAIVMIYEAWVDMVQ